MNTVPSASSSSSPALKSHHHKLKNEKKKSNLKDNILKVYSKGMQDGFPSMQFDLTEWYVSLGVHILLYASIMIIIFSFLICFFTMILIANSTVEDADISELCELIDQASEKVRCIL